MDRFPAGTRAASPAPSAWFTGEVTLTPVIEAPAPARLRAVLVGFAPGARTHWHRHPLGQALHIVSGRGLAQAEGGPVVALLPGDTLWFAPGERHWHGAAPDCAMTHLALHEAEDCVTTTDWEGPVSDAEYGG